MHTLNDDNVDRDNTHCYVRSPSTHFGSNIVDESSFVESPMVCFYHGDPLCFQKCLEMEYYSALTSQTHKAANGLPIFPMRPEASVSAGIRARRHRAERPSSSGRANFIFSYVSVLSA